MSQCSCAVGVHPDLIQVWSRKVTDGSRYEVYPHDAYLLRARLTPAPGKVGISVRLYTSEAPASAGDDELLLPLYVSDAGNVDIYAVTDMNTAIRFDNGIYAVAGSNTPADTAYLHVAFVDRRHYCPAFARVQQTLTDCWDTARNSGLSRGDPAYEPYLTNFSFYERENPTNPETVTGGDPTAGDPI